MEDVKKWYLSKTVWGAMITILASLAKIGGVDVDAGIQTEILNSVMALVTAGGGLLALFGRISATKSLKA
ncbi:hypothetical protein FJU08_13955 [Martelella alba]|uniref:Holin n=1 Tax=Martelella alba TaxID=2590451 RepID=A0A506U7W5_9HYPH|nr:hypothetical protein [Martelella alba]TPW29436.1 hypothetical protein FJU08_13955 [Martelella alba]